MSTRRIVAGAGVVAALAVLALFFAGALFGLPINPGTSALGLLVVGALAFLIAVVGIRRGKARLAWIVVATEVLCIGAAIAFRQLLWLEGDLVSESKSPAMVHAFLWPALVVGVAAFVAMLIGAAKLITRPGTRPQDTA